MSCGPRNHSSPVSPAPSRAPVSGSTTTACVRATSRPTEPWQRRVLGQGDRRALGHAQRLADHAAEPRLAFALDLGRARRGADEQDSRSDERS